MAENTGHVETPRCDAEMDQCENVVMDVLVNCSTQHYLKLRRYFVYTLDVDEHHIHERRRASLSSTRRKGMKKKPNPLSNRLCSSTFS